VAKDISGQAPGGADTTGEATVDAESHALPGWAETTKSCGSSTGVAGVPGGGGNPYLSPRSPTPNMYQCQAQVPGGASENKLDLTTTNLDAVTVDVPRAGLPASGAWTLSATGDGPVTVTLDGYSGRASGSCVQNVTQDTGSTTLRLQLGAAACPVSLG
jgi:hypothetical protein